MPSKSTLYLLHFIPWFPPKNNQFAQELNMCICFNDPTFKKWYHRIIFQRASDPADPFQSPKTQFKQSEFKKKFFLFKKWSCSTVILSRVRRSMHCKTCIDLCVHHDNQDTKQLHNPQNFFVWPLCSQPLFCPQLSAATDLTPNPSSFCFKNVIWMASFTMWLFKPGFFCLA